MIHFEQKGIFYQKILASAQPQILFKSQGTHKSFCCLHTQIIDVVDDYNQNLDFSLCWIGQNGCFIEAYAIGNKVECACSNVQNNHLRVLFFVVCSSS